MICCYTHRYPPYPIIILKASSGNKWEQMHRTTARHVRRKSKLEISTKTHTSELRESRQKGGRKIAESAGIEDTKIMCPSESSRKVAYEPTYKGVYTHTRI